MAPQKIMVWVDKLPEVGDPILKRREAIAAKMQQAAELQCQVYQLRQEAGRHDPRKVDGC